MCEIDKAAVWAYYLKIWKKYRKKNSSMNLPVIVSGQGMGSGVQITSFCYKLFSVIWLLTDVFMCGFFFFMPFTNWIHKLKACYGHSLREFCQFTGTWSHKTPFKSWDITKQTPMFVCRGDHGIEWTGNERVLKESIIRRVPGGSNLGFASC